MARNRIHLVGKTRASPRPGRGREPCGEARRRGSPALRGRVTSGQSFGFTARRRSDPARESCGLGNERKTALQHFSSSSSGSFRRSHSSVTSPMGSRRRLETLVVGQHPGKAGGAPIKAGCRLTFSTGPMGPPQPHRSVGPRGPRQPTRPLTRCARPPDGRLPSRATPSCKRSRGRLCRVRMVSSCIEPRLAAATRLFA